MPLHPAENRGYRELYLSGRQAVKRLGRLASAFDGTATRELLDKATESISRMLGELGPLTARHDLHGGVTAQTGGANVGLVRGAVLDRFLERNQALRLAVTDLQHLVTLLGYLEQVARSRGDDALRGFCSEQRSRLMPVERTARAAAIELGSTPDQAIQPLDDSAAGKLAHGAAYAMGSVGEWFDRRAGNK